MNRAARSRITLGILTGTILLAGALCAQAFAAVAPYPAVEKFDLNRFLGTWYEIARMPSPFEGVLVNVTAKYALRPDGKVSVINDGYEDNVHGKYSKITGKAWFGAKPDQGYLIVSFFWPLSADYVIVDLDPDYQWALIITSPRYMWILSRKPTLDKATTHRLVSTADSLGLDIDKLEFIPQEW